MCVCVWVYVRKYFELKNEDAMDEEVMFDRTRKLRIFFGLEGGGGGKGGRTRGRGKRCVVFGIPFSSDFVFSPENPGARLWKLFFRFKHTQFCAPVHPEIMLVPARFFFAAIVALDVLPVAQLQRTFALPHPGEIRGRGDK